MRPVGPLACLLLLPGLAAAAPPEPVNTEQISASLRGLLLQNLPDPLVESHSGWGDTREVWNGTTWHGLHPQPQHKRKNHGTWRRMRVSVDRPEATLKLALAHLATPEPGRLTFDVAIEFDANLQFELQIWDAGVRLYSGETRGRCHVRLLLACEATTRVEKAGLLPEAVIRLRVVKSYLDYDQFVCEHTAGVGGSAAKLLGEAALHFLHEWRPGLERDLLERGNAAIVKAGDTREIRLGFGRLTRFAGMPNDQGPGAG
jgi:hypothetical protein